MIIVGIDQSIRATGLAVVNLTESGESSIVGEPKVLLNDERGPHALVWLSREVAKYIRASRDPSGVVVCLEGYSMGSKGGHIFQLGEVGGVIKMTALDCCMRDSVNVRIMSLPPTTWRKTLLDTAHMQKDTSYLLKAYEFTGVKFVDDNAADASMIALAAAKILNWSRGGSGGTPPEKWVSQTVLKAYKKQWKNKPPGDDERRTIASSLVEKFTEAVYEPILETT